jgi:mannitol operon transcriptional antiterminator
MLLHAVMRMMPLTTVQRDLLYQLLTSDGPISAPALSQALHLTPRQVRYGLREIRAWLSLRQVSVHTTPGVGVQIGCAPDQKRRLLAELASHARFQLILLPEQRQQLLALQLLASRKPFILSQLQEHLAVARATVLKDLDALEPWFERFQLSIARRQHRGFWIEGDELAKRQALAALIWGDLPFGQPILAVHSGQGIVFALAQDAALLPIVGRIDALVRALNLRAAQDYVTWIETKLGGRFTDEAVAQLALACAIQIQRVGSGQRVAYDGEKWRWAEAQAAWPVIADLGARLWPELPSAARDAEAAVLAIQLISGSRDEPWQSDLGADDIFHSLVDRLLAHIAHAYGVPELAHDQLLRDGLEAHILPACVRQRFGLWAPPKTATDTDTERYAAERIVAAQLALAVEEATGTALPPDTTEDLILLLRAAIVRARPERARRVLVVCPSGMATTQLLLARLKARLPRLGTFEVMPMRELTTARVVEADLIISTVPLSLPAGLPIDVIQVHPMLKPEDILALTQWMA